MKTATKLWLPVVLAGLAAATGACKKKSKDKSDDAATDTVDSAESGQVAVSNIALKLDAKGVDSSDSASLLLSAQEGFALTASAAYPGIGINSGESVVEGLKIWLTGVSIENQVDSDAANTENHSAVVFDWSASPKELQIAKGFAGTLTDSVNTYLKPGEYNRMSVSMLDKLSIKAYAYLDVDNDGTTDTTIYTTADAVKKVSEVLDPTAMPTDYAYYTYGYISALTANSLTASTKTATTLTVFDTPVVIPSTDVDAKAAAGETEASGTTPPVSLAVSLIVDTTYLMKAWDGRFATAENTPYVRGNGTVPQPEFPFPMDAVAAHGRRSDPGLTQLDFYPEGKPAFGLGNYVPMFAFANIGKPSFRVYAFSLDQDFDTFWAPNQVGGYRKTLILTVAFDATGKPLLARTTTLAESQELFIGAIGRIFEKQTDETYTFRTNYGVKNTAGKDDGGLYYHADKTMAGHVFSGLDVSAEVGDTFQVLQEDGPRCNEQYDYCVGTGGKALWVKRLK